MKWCEVVYQETPTGEWDLPCGGRIIDGVCKDCGAADAEEVAA